MTVAVRIPASGSSSDPPRRRSSSIEDAALREDLRDPRPPLDDRDRVLDALVEVEIVEFGKRAEAVGVDVDEGGPPRRRVGALAR